MFYLKIDKNLTDYIVLFVVGFIVRKTKISSQKLDYVDLASIQRFHWIAIVRFFSSLLKSVFENARI